jgi:serine/threonine protein kinase
LGLVAHQQVRRFFGEQLGLNASELDEVALLVQSQAELSLPSLFAYALGRRALEVAQHRAAVFARAEVTPRAQNCPAAAATPPLGWHPRAFFAVTNSASIATPVSGERNADAHDQDDRTPSSGQGAGVMRFGRYRLLEDIGAGGMAVVSRAIVDGPRGFAREIVIKRILREFSSYPSFVRMLATEARLSARLRHPGIVQVHEFGEVDGEYYLAMELVDGSDLRDVIQACIQRGRRLPVGVASFIVAEVASALAYAHQLTDERGRALCIVHRDVSPSNVMVTPVGTVKLLDFGIAHAEDHIRDDQTRTTLGSLKGKLSYLSPEQADGRPVDGRSDIFSLGVVFHELLTNKRLFRGTSELDTMRLIREAVVAPPSASVGDVPGEIDAVVTKMLARAPDDRYQSGDELVAALTPIVRRLEGDSVALRNFLQKLAPIGRRAVAAPSPRRDSARSRSSSLRGSYGEAKAITKTTLSGLIKSSRMAWAGISVAVIGLSALLGSASFPARDRVTPAPPLPPPAASLPFWGAPGAQTVPTLVQPQAPPMPTSATTASATTTTKPDPAATSPTEEGADKVRLSVTGTEGAEVLVDGVLLGTVPLQIALPPLAGIRHVAVRRSGFKRWTCDIDGRKDAALVAPLERSRASTRAPGAPPLLKDPFQ